jgi:hypothetical protein
MNKVLKLVCSVNIVFFFFVGPPLQRYVGMPLEEYQARLAKSDLLRCTWAFRMRNRDHVSVDKFEFGLYSMCLYLQPTAHNAVQYVKDLVRMGKAINAYSKTFQKVLRVTVKRCGWVGCINVIANGNVCGGCMRIRYCSTQCQRVARPYHKRVCSLQGPLTHIKN